MLVGSKFVRDFMAAKLKEVGTWAKQGRAEGQHVVQILITIILSLPALAKESNSSISLNSAYANTRHC